MKNLYKNKKKYYSIVDGEGNSKSGWYNSYNEALKDAAKENGLYVKSAELEHCTLCKNIYSESCTWCH